MTQPLHNDHNKNQHKLLTAVYSNDIQTVREFLPQAGITWHTENVFCFACQKGRLEIVELLLPVSDPNVHDGRPLQQAVGGGSVDVVRFLLPHCDAKLMRSEALQMAILEGDQRMFDLLTPHSKCNVALKEVTKSIRLLEVSNPNVLQLHNQLKEIVGAQRQQKTLNDTLKSNPVKDIGLGRKI